MLPSPWSSLEREQFTVEADTGHGKLMYRHDSLFRDFGATIEKVANSYGCSVNRTYCGHGINSLFHPAPSIPHYAKNKAPHYCKPGMVGHLCSCWRWQCCDPR